MTEYKTKVVLDLLAVHNFQGTPEELLKKLIYEDIESLGNDVGIDDLETRLVLLGSLRGLKRPMFQDLGIKDSGRTDGKDIFINSSHPRSRQLFTWGHEITHSYFPSSSGVKTDAFGQEHHCSGENREEELLCDFGASLILFYGTSADNFDISNLLKIMENTGASAEAAAISMVKNANSEVGMIVWSRKGKKGENPNQACMFADEEKNPFRIDYASCKGLFLPKNKSVDEGEAIDTCELEDRSSGVIQIGKYSDLYSDNLKISGDRILTLFKR